MIMLVTGSVLVELEMLYIVVLAMLENCETIGVLGKVATESSEVVVMLKSIVVFLDVVEAVKISDIDVDIFDNVVSSCEVVAVNGDVLGAKVSIEEVDVEVINVEVVTSNVAIEVISVVCGVMSIKDATDKLSVVFTAPVVLLVDDAIGVMASVGVVTAVVAEILSYEDVRLPVLVGEVKNGVLEVSGGIEVVEDPAASAADVVED